MLNDKNNLHINCLLFTSINLEFLLTLSITKVIKYFFVPVGFILFKLKKNIFFYKFL